MRAALLTAGLALAAVCGNAVERPGSHSAPAPSLASEPESPGERRIILAEMWQRRILASDANVWSPEDFSLLSRIRAVEKDALILLRRKERSLARLVIEQKAPGARQTVPRLSKEGYHRYIFLLSQDAVEFFGRKGVDAKFVFKLKDVQGRPLFEDGGRLTEIGERIYTRGRLGMAVSWMTHTGEVLGTRQRPMPAESGPPGADPGPAADDGP